MNRVATKPYPANPSKTRLFPGHQIRSQSGHNTNDLWPGDARIPEGKASTGRRLVLDFFPEFLVMSKITFCVVETPFPIRHQPQICFFPTPFFRVCNGGDELRSYFPRRTRPSSAHHRQKANDRLHFSLLHSTASPCHKLQRQPPATQVNSLPVLPPSKPNA